MSSSSKNAQSVSLIFKLGDRVFGKFPWEKSSASSQTLYQCHRHPGGSDLFRRDSSLPREPVEEAQTGSGLQWIILSGGEKENEKEEPKSNVSDKHATAAAPETCSQISIGARFVGQRKHLAVSLALGSSHINGSHGWILKRGTTNCSQVCMQVPETSASTI